MRLKLILGLIFSFSMQFSINAQVKYSSEELTKVYDTETIVLTQNGYEKNGVETPHNPVFPNAALRKEIEKNGGKEANIQYRKYRKTLGTYWIASGLGFVLALAPLFVIDTVAKTSVAFLLGISLAGSLVLTIGSLYLGRKLYRYLAYSVWHHNKNVLLNKPS